MTTTRTETRNSRMISSTTTETTMTTTEITTITTTITITTTAITETTTAKQKTTRIALLYAIRASLFIAITLLFYTIFNSASSPFIPTCMPSVSASIVTDSSGAFNNCSIVFTPTALPATIFRSANTLFNNPTSNAP